MSKEKTLEEWIKFYNSKCPEPFERDESGRLYYRSDKGFCEIDVQPQILTIFQGAGDIKFWRQAAEFLCKSLRVKTYGAYICRHVKPFIRVSGFRIYETEETPDGERYYFQDAKTGQKGQAQPAWIKDNGNIIYFATAEV